MYMDFSKVFIQALWNCLIKYNKALILERFPNEVWKYDLDLVSTCM